MKSINLLDPAQKKTLEALVDDNNKNALSIVYGPPGTGKSHLITSLLFELALKGKKVLFVSQNTEALDVIVRMYEKYDKSMHKTKNDLCFLDFCLQLNNPACRKIKYLKEHKSVIMSQKVAPQYIGNTTTESDKDDLTPYKLSYRYLNGEGNNTPELLGIDELLVYQMKYINDSSTAKSVIYGIEDVDIRNIFRHLDEYKYKESFRFLNNPDNQLKYINKDNKSIGFNTLKAVSSELLNKLFNIPKAHFSSKSDMDILEYLNNLLSISRWQNFIDLKMLETTRLSGSDILDSAERTLALYDQFSNCEKIDITNNDISFTKNSIEIVSNCSSLNELTETHALSNDFANRLKKNCKDYGINSDYFTIDQLTTYLLRKIDINNNCSDLLKEIPGLEKYSAQNIDNLIEDLKAWDQNVGLFGKRKTPAGNLGQLTFYSKENAEYLFANIEYLQYLIELLSGTNYLITDLLSLGKNNVSSNIYSPIEHESKMSSDDIKNLINLLLKIKEYHWCDNCANINDSIKTLDDLSGFSIFIKENIELNKYKHFNSISDAIHLIAQNINNNNNYQQISEIEEKYGQYNINKDDDFKTFCAKVADSDINKLNDILEKIENIGEYINTSSDNIISLINYINDIRENDNANNVFNDSFYKISSGENLNNWLDRCNNIIAFNNINEFDGFIEHNDFIKRLKALFGDKRNFQLIEQYLDMNIDYDAFCNYLCRDIIESKIGSMSTTDRKNINNASFFKLYKQGNLVERSRHYDRGLYSLKLKYEEPSRVLTDAINKTTGMHNIERYRKCSEKIIDAFPVIIATPSEVSKYIDSKRFFDYVVFDEASQLLPGQALPSLYRAERAIIVGDPHQMPPSLTTVIGFNDYDEDDEQEEFGQSILDMVKGLQTANEYHLTTHYRSESNQLFEPSRKAIYEEEGIRPIFEAKSDRMPIYISDNLGEDNNANFGKIIQRIRYYLAKDPDNASFCVLFSRGDLMGLNAFRKYFDNNGANLQDIVKLYDENRLLISTIRDCQGIEGDHTILYLPQYRSISSMWFFNEKAGAYKRLNVAVTRQRKTLDLIMGDSRGKWLSECQRILNEPIGPNQEKSAKLFMTLLSKAGQEINDEYLDKELASNANNIDSPLTEQLYKKLCNHYKDRIGEDLRIWCEVGYKLVVPTNDAVSQNHDNVGYRIDIGIYSIKHRKFILGIEMDGSTYHNGFIKEFSDLQRQDILEMKGWNIYRIWSTNWIKNTEHEFSNLTAEIDELLNQPIENDESLNTEKCESSPNIDAVSTNNSIMSPEEKSSNTKSDNSAIIMRRDIIEENKFTRDFLKSCRKSMECGTFLRIKRDNTPEFEDIIIHDIAQDASYILAKYEKTSSFFKVKVDKIESFIMENQ